MLRQGCLTLKIGGNDMINMWPKQPMYALGNQISTDITLKMLSKYQTFFSN